MNKYDKLDKLYDKLYEDFEEDILINFNFYKVKLVMEALDWSWQGDKKSPSVLEMEKHVRTLFNHVYERLEKEEDGGVFSISSGGFEVTMSSGGYVSLSFIVEEWENDV